MQANIHRQDEQKEAGLRMDPTAVSQSHKARDFSQLTSRELTDGVERMFWSVAAGEENPEPC